MKKIKLILVSLFAVAMTLSCDDDGGDSKIHVEQGAVPNIVKSETYESILNLVEIQEGNSVTIGFSIDIFEGDVSSLDIVGIYVKLDGTAEKVILAENVTTFPTSMTLTKEQLIEKYALLNGDADFELGDQLKISANLTLANGTVIDLLEDDGSQNYGQDIANSLLFSVTQVYTVSCPSDLAGTYSVLTSGASTDTGPTPAENPITDHPYTVTITGSGGSYTLSDAYGGLYLLWYDIYGITGDESGTFTDVCGTLSGTFPEPFGGNTTITGTVNSDGTLSIHWENEFGDFGDSVYTKN